MREPEFDEEKASLMVSTTAFANEQTNTLQDDLNALAKAKGEDMQPILDEINALDSITDVNEYAERLAELESKILELSSGGKNEAEAMMKIVKDNLTNPKK